MHPEAEVAPAEDQLFKEHHDLIQLDAELTQQAELIHPGHGPGCECDHHHADVHIDHPEDHLHEPAEVHDDAGHRPHTEAGHSEHEEHVHGPGCGHVEHEQAHEHIDHHVHSEACGHVHHGEAKTHVDHGHEDNHSAERPVAEHVHHEGCGHVSHEHAEGHVDKDHVHSANCGHIHHHEAEVHVDHAKKPKHEAHDHSHASEEHVHGPGCGHVEHEHAHHHADHSEHHDHSHIPEVAKAEEQAAQPVTYEREAAFAQQRETEAARQQATLRAEAVDEHIAPSVEIAQPTASEVIEPEPVMRPEVVEVIPPEQQPQRQIIEAAEVLDSSMTDLAEQSSDEAVDAMDSEVPPTVTLEDTSEVTAAPVEATITADPVQETDMEGQLDAITESHEVATVSEPADNMELYAEAALETTTTPTPASESTNVSGMESTNPDLSEADVLEIPMVVADEVFTEMATMHETSELEATIDTLVEQVLPVMQEAVTQLSQPEVSADTSAIEVPEFTAIEEQFKMLEEMAGSRKPEVLTDLHKSIANLHAALHDGAGEANAAKVSKEFLRLLTLLGFERPSETLQLYIQRYGMSSMDDMLARLFELLRQSRSMEAVSPLGPLFISLPADPQGTQTVGKTVLALLTKLHGASRQELALAA